MRFLTFSDPHISAVNPQSRVGSYLSDIRDKLSQIGAAGKKLGVSFYVLAGDLFNLKAPMRNPHSLNTTLIEIFKGFGAPVYAVEGNHDLKNDSYASFSEQPLSVLYSDGTLKQIRDEVISDGEVSVRLRGFPFVEEPDLSALPKRVAGTDLSVAVMHLFSSLDGGMYHLRKVFSYKELAVLGDDLFVMGHYHFDQGISTIRHEGRDVTFINLGAVSRGAIIEDNLQRIPKIGYVEVVRKADKVSVSVQAVRLRAKPAAEVFDLESKGREKKRMEEAEAFVERLRIEQSDQDALGRVDAEIDSMKLEKDVLDSVTHYMQEAEMALKGPAR